MGIVAVAAGRMGDKSWGAAEREAPSCGVGGCGLLHRDGVLVVSTASRLSTGEQGSRV